LEGCTAFGDTVPGAPDFDTTTVGATSFPLKAAINNFTKPSTAATTPRYGASHDGALEVAQFNVPAMSLQPTLSNTPVSKLDMVITEVKIVWNRLEFMFVFLWFGV
jgi:hypothetical protein